MWYVIKIINFKLEHSDAMTEEQAKAYAILIGGHAVNGYPFGGFKDRGTL